MRRSTILIHPLQLVFPADISKELRQPLWLNGISCCQWYYQGAKASLLLSWMALSGNTKGGSITVPLTSRLTGLESAV